MSHPPSRKTAIWAVIAVIAFVGLAAVVEIGWQRPLDLAFTRVLIRIAGPVLDAFGGIVSILFAFEAVTVYAFIAALLLNRRRAVLVSLAPFGFMALTAFELG